MLVLTTICRYLDIRVSRVYKYLHKKVGVRVNELAARFRADFMAGLTYWDTDPAPSPSNKLPQNCDDTMPSPQSAIRSLQLHPQSPIHGTLESIQQEEHGSVRSRSAAAHAGGGRRIVDGAEMLDPVEAIVRAASISQP